MTFFAYEGVQITISNGQLFHKAYEISFQGVRIQLGMCVGCLVLFDVHLSQNDFN